MKKLYTVVLIVVLAMASGLLAQEKTQRVAGNWSLSLETPHGTMGASLLLKQEGSKVTGTCESDHMGSMAVTGSVENGKIALSIALPEGEPVKLVGAVEGDKMSGTTDFQWSAARK